MDEMNIEPIEPGGMTDEEIAEMERQRREAEEAKLAPSKAAREQRQTSADIVAEHDELMAEMLFEITMNKFGEEV